MEENKEEALKELTEQDKQDVLKMDEMTTFFFIDECGLFIFNMGHDLNHDKIPEDKHSAVKNDIMNIQQLQKFAVFGLERFDVDPTSVQDRENGEYVKWFKHWDKWRNELSEETWKIVQSAMESGSPNEYNKYIPKKNYKGNKIK